MPHFPKPFYRQARRRWYVEVGSKQINLGPDRDKAFRQYHELMAFPEQTTNHPLATSQRVAVLCDRFLHWVETHRAKPTYEAYLYRLQRFIDCYPDITVDQLRPFHVHEWVDQFEVSATTRVTTCGASRHVSAGAASRGTSRRAPWSTWSFPRPTAKRSTAHQSSSPNY